MGWGNSLPVRPGQESHQLTPTAKRAPIGISTHFSTPEADHRLRVNQGPFQGITEKCRQFRCHPAPDWGTALWMTRMPITHKMLAEPEKRLTEEMWGSTK